MIRVELVEECQGRHGHGAAFAAAVPLAPWRPARGRGYPWEPSERSTETRTVTARSVGGRRSAWLAVNALLALAMLTLLSACDPAAEPTAPEIRQARVQSDVDLEEHQPLRPCFSRAEGRFRRSRLLTRSCREHLGEVVEHGASWSLPNSCRAFTRPPSWVKVGASRRSRGAISTFWATKRLISCSQRICSSVNSRPAFFWRPIQRLKRCSTPTAKALQRVGLADRVADQRHQLRQHLLHRLTPTFAASRRLYACQTRAVSSTQGGPVKACASSCSCA